MGVQLPGAADVEVEKLQVEAERVPAASHRVMQAVGGVLRDTAEASSRPEWHRERQRGNSVSTCLKAISSLIF